MGSIDSKAALIQVMTWHWAANKLVLEQVMNLFVKKHYEWCSW